MKSFLSKLKHTNGLHFLNGWLRQRLRVDLFPCTWPSKNQASSPNQLPKLSVINGGDRHIQKTIQPTHLGQLSNRGMIHPPIDYQGSLHNLEDQGQVRQIPSHPLAHCCATSHNAGRKPPQTGNVSALQLFSCKSSIQTPLSCKEVPFRMNSNTSLAALRLLVLSPPWSNQCFESSSEISKV